MLETGTRVRQIISEKTMLDRLARSEQAREFFIQMWRQNPILVKQAGAKVQNLMAQLDRRDEKEKPQLLSDVEGIRRVAPIGGEPPEKISSVLCTPSSERGISLIELIMFIVIVSVALTGIMLAMNTTAKYSADPLIHKQALTVAESLLEEIELQNFTPGSFAGPFDQANRHRFDDIMDYSHGFATTGVYPARGTVAVSGLQNYNVAVAVSAVVWDNIPSTSAVQITVTVSDPSGQSLEAIGYRVAY